MIEMSAYPPDICTGQVTWVVGLLSGRRDMLQPLRSRRVRRAAAKGPPALAVAFLQVPDQTLPDLTSVADARPSSCLIVAFAVGSRLEADGESGGSCCLVLVSRVRVSA